MKINQTLTDHTILTELGGRIARLRLQKNLRQSELARQAGVSLRTIQRLESGAVATQLSGFIRVCRVLGLLENFARLVPEPVASPIAQLDQRGKQRKRAAGFNSAPTTVQEPSPRGKWTWGETT